MESRLFLLTVPQHTEKHAMHHVTRRNNIHVHVPRKNIPCTLKGFEAKESSCLYQINQPPLRSKMVHPLFLQSFT